MGKRQKWTTHDGAMRFLPKGTRVRHVPWKKDGTVTGEDCYDVLEELGVDFDDGTKGIVKAKSLIKLASPRHGGADE